MSSIPTPIHVFDPQKALGALQLTTVDQGGEFHVQMDTTEQFFQIFDLVGWMVRQAIMTPQVTYKLLERSVIPPGEKSASDPTAQALLNIYRTINGEGRFNHCDGGIKYGDEALNLAYIAQARFPAREPGGYNHTSGAGVLHAFDIIHGWHLSWAGEFKKQLTDQNFIYVEGVEGPLRAEVGAFLKEGDWVVEGEGNERHISYTPASGGETICLKVRNARSIDAEIVMQAHGWSDTTTFDIRPDELAGIYASPCELIEKARQFQDGARHLCILNEGYTPPSDKKPGGELNQINAVKRANSKPLGWFIATDGLARNLHLPDQGVLNDWETTRIAALDVERKGYNRRYAAERAEQTKNDFGDSHHMINAALMQSWHLLHTLVDRFDLDPVKPYASVSSKAQSGSDGHLHHVKDNLEKSRRTLMDPQKDGEGKLVRPMVLLHAAVQMVQAGLPDVEYLNGRGNLPQLDTIDPDASIFPREFSRVDFPRGMLERLGQYAIPTIAAFYKLSLDGQPIVFPNNRVPELTLRCPEEFAIMISAVCLNLEHLLINILAAGAREYRGSEVAIHYSKTLDAIGEAIVNLDFAQRVLDYTLAIDGNVHTANPGSIPLKEYLRAELGLGTVETLCLGLSRNAVQMSQLPLHATLADDLMILTKVAGVIESSDCVRNTTEGMSSALEMIARSIEKIRLFGNSRGDG
jgi:hypothetical protein